MDSTNHNNAPHGVSLVIPYVTATVIWEELRFALRSIYKNALFDHVVFLIAEEKPAWLSESVHLIPVKQIQGQPYSKAMDAYRKLKAVCEDPRVSDDFVYTYDDTLFNSPLYLSMLKATRKAHPEILSVEDLNKQLPTAGKIWRDGFTKAFTLLKERGLPTFNFETHMPRLFNKIKVLEVFEEFGLDSVNAEKGKAMCGFATLYFNYHYKTKPQVLTPANPFKGELRRPLDPKDVEAMFNSKLFVNFTDQGLTSSVKKVIEERFPVPCPYETLQ